MTRAAILLCALAAACSASEGDRAGSAPHAVAVGPAWEADPPVPAPMTGKQLGAAAAFDGTNYLVAWVDQRARYGASVMIERVAADGTVLDPGGRAIFVELDTLLYPGQVAVGFDGASYLVVWAGYGVFAKRVSTDGVSLDENPIQLSSSRRGAGPVATAFDGARFMVAWSSPVPSSSQTDVYASRVSTLGEDLDATDLRVARSSYYETLQGLAASGNDFLVLWHVSGNFRTRGAFVGATDANVSASFAVAAAEIDSAAAAFDGSNYVVAWHRSGGVFGNPNIFARRIAPGGGFLEEPVPIGIGSEVSAAFDGTSTFVTWTRDIDYLTRAIEGLRLSSDLAVLDDPPFEVSSVLGPWGKPVVAAGNAGALVLWRDLRYGITDDDVFGARLDSDGTVLTPNGLSMVSGANVQRATALAFDGIEFLAAWEDHRDRTTDIYTVEIDREIGPRAPAQPRADGPNWHAEAAIAASPAGQLVAWTERPDTSPSDPDIYAERFDASGNRLDDPPLVFAAPLISQEKVSVAASSTGYLLAWSEWRDGARRTYAARLGLEGTSPDDSGILVDSDGETPAVASNGDGYLIASVGNTVNGRDLRLHVATQNDGVLGPPLVYPASVEQGGRPSASWNGQHYVVAWNGSGGINSAVLAARFASDGTAIDTQPVRFTTSIGGYPRIASGDRTSLVSWRDGDGVRAAWFTSTGAVVPPDGFAIAAVETTFGWRPEPAVACDPDARCLVAFEQASVEEPRTPRIQLVRVTLVDIDGDEIDDEFDPDVTPPAPDAAPPDSGDEPDAGVDEGDAGPGAADAGASPTSDDGCGCDAGKRGTDTALALFIAAMALVRRRVRGRASGRPRTR